MSLNLKFHSTPFPTTGNHDVSDPGGLANGSGQIWKNLTTTPGSITFPPGPAPAVVTQPFCEWILYEDLGKSRVRIWDMIILIPNAFFLMFLFWNFKMALLKLRQSNSPIFMAFYTLVFLAAVISVLRCVVGMTVNASVEAGDITDKVLWLVLRFFLLATELSVIVFGLAFGHLDSRTSIRRVLMVTSLFAFIYSCTQGTLEFVNPDPKFHLIKGGAKNYDIFAHGGMIFWMTTSAFFFIVYTTIFVSPWTVLNTKLNLPSKKSFYYYALALAVLNCAQTVGSSLLYTEILNGMCVVDLTAFLYFTCFHPLVYGTFLRDFFKATPQTIPFSYKQQTDETADEDTVSLPYQPDSSGSSQRSQKVVFPTFSDNESCDSTHFDRQSSVNAYIANSLNHDTYGNDAYKYQNI